MGDFNGKYLDMAIDLAVENVKSGAGGPFGAVVVKDGVIIAKGVNLVVSEKDPTAHAEVIAIRRACQALGSFQLDGCEIYTSCEPCPMCLGAIYWARPSAVYYAATQEEAAKAGFDDLLIYEELGLPQEHRRVPMTHVPHARHGESFQAWKAKKGRVDY